MKVIDWITYILVLVGALNWGLVGAFHFNLVEWIFGMSVVTTIVYYLVGLSAIWMFFATKRHCCKK